MTSDFFLLRFLCGEEIYSNSYFNSSGIKEGSEISIYYDSMICKLVSYADDRETALNIMDKALDSYVIRGLAHNISLLRDICDNENFRKGDFNTSFLQEEYPDGFSGRKLSVSEKNELVLGAAFMHLKREAKASKFLNQKIAVPVKLDKFELFVKLDGVKYQVNGEFNGSGLTASVDGGDVAKLNSNWDSSSLLVDANIGGNEVIFQNISREGQSYKIQHCGTVFQLDVADSFQNEMEMYMKEKVPEG